MGGAVRLWGGCGHRSIVAPVDVGASVPLVRDGNDFVVVTVSSGAEFAQRCTRSQRLPLPHERDARATFANAKLRAAVSTPQSSSAGKIVRFGVFAADLAAGELRKNGVRIRLQEQPFQVLALLLERPGEVVTREELRQKFWPADTFVDFDHSLNTAVNKLREALGDSASSPRYVETLARRGYRFLAPVERDETKARIALHRPAPRPAARRRRSETFIAISTFPCPIAV